MTWAVDGGELLASRSGRFVPWERAPDSHSVGFCVDPRFGLDAVEGTILPHRDSKYYPSAIAIPTSS
jgi:hypothetical protein